MNDQNTPLHEGMRTCPMCNRPNIFTVKDDERGTGGARCHYCHTLITISAAPLAVQGLQPVEGIEP